MNSRDYIGREYTGEHVCLQCVQAICEGEHGYPAGQSVETFYAWLQANTHEVASPQPGDFAVFFHSQWHIGYVIEGERFVHCYKGGMSLISDLGRTLYAHTVTGYFRLNETTA